MSFGFSAGDFIAAAKLIADIVSCLKRVGGAVTEYQELERQLFALERALDEIEHLRVPESQQNAANAIKVAALQCRYSLEDYAGKFKKYADTLSSGSTTGGVLRGVKRKLQFGLGMRKEAQELRIYILVHLGTLSTRLLSLGLLVHLRSDAGHVADASRTSMSIMSDDTKTLHANQERRIGEAAQTIQTSQGVALQETKSILGQLLDLVKNDVVMRLDQVINIATKAWISQCQVLDFLLKWGTDLPYPDVSHTWFQRPCRLEDPLGRYHPIASEYSYSQMLAVVLDKFQSGSGSRRIQSGDYEIANFKNSSQLINKETFTGLIPGMSLRMAIILHELKAMAEICPIPSCGSRTSSDCVGGGKTCSECGTWFEFESGTRVRVEEAQNSEQDIGASNGAEDGSCLERASKRRMVDSQVQQELSDEDDFEAFKNVWLGRFDPIKPSNEEPLTEAQQVISRPAEDIYMNDSPSDKDLYSPGVGTPLHTNHPPFDLGTFNPTNWPELPREYPPSRSRFNRSIRKRRKRTQPSQGDSVLISYLDPNRPDIARDAGEETLDSDSVSEAGGSDAEDAWEGENPAKENVTAAVEADVVKAFKEFTIKEKLKV